MASSETTTAYDLKNTISDSRLVGLWRMMTGFRLLYLLLRCFVDNVLRQSIYSRLT